MNILITGIGGPTPRSIARSIAKTLPNAKIYGTDTSRLALGFYMNGLVDESIIVPKANEPTYWENIINIIESFKIDIAFVQPEAEVLEWGRYFKKHGNYPCQVLIPPVDHVEVLMDKAKMADLLVDTDYIPKTISITPELQSLNIVMDKIGYPCWIRASVGSGGLGSLKLEREADLKAWLYIHKNVPTFTVSEFLPGRHLANQMLYLNGKLIKNAGLECVNYVMADIAPSKVTGNTSFGRFLNEEMLLVFCEEVMDYIYRSTGVSPHGVYSFDLKEDSNHNMKVTEINIRHMAYTGIMAKLGFDLIEDSIKFMTSQEKLIKNGHHLFNGEIFLRDVDIEPIIMKEIDIKAQ